MRASNASADVSEIRLRVNYSEIDQMGVVYHARYLVWLDVARTEHLRQSGMSYRELEERGLRMVVAELSVRYRQRARFDDPVRVRCWVRDVASRQVEFGYVVEHGEDGGCSSPRRRPCSRSTPACVRPGCPTRCAGCSARFPIPFRSKLPGRSRTPSGVDA